MKIVQASKAMKLAKQFRPVFVQEFGSVLDMICPINLGDFVVPDKPVVYFSAMEDEGFYYLLYCVYHYRDYSTWPPPFKEWDEHRHDFEGVLIVFNRKLKEVVATATRCHKAINCYGTSALLPGPEARQWFQIEAGGHGITSIRQPNAHCEENRIIYKDYKLINMSGGRVYNWLKDKAEPELKKHGATFPWRWNDWHIKRRFGKKTDGLIWSNPSEFLRLAKRCHLF